jgi:hypothetical protein
VGSNLRTILEQPEVNAAYTTTTNIAELTNIYGIELARCRHVAMYMEQLGDGINFKHYNLVANEISVTGELTGVTSKGASLRGSSPLQGISDEKPIQVITKAALNRTGDNITGVSSNILLSQTPKIGNNYSSFTLDLDYCKVSDDIGDLMSEFK